LFFAIFLFNSKLLDALKYTAPSRAAVPAKPYKRSFTYNMCSGNETPKAAVLASMAVIAHHPVIIVFESVSI